MTGTGIRTDRLRTLESVVWIGAIAVLAFALVAAGIQAARWLPSALEAGAHHLGIAARIGAIVVAAVASLGVGLWLSARGRWRLAVAVAIVALVAVRLLAIAVLPSPITSDWAGYLDLANRMLDGQGFWSARPPGFPLALAAALALGGPAPISGELLNLGVSVAGGLLIARLVAPAFGRTAALLGLFCYALLPEAALWTLILGVETLYAAVLVGLAVLAVAALRAGRHGALLAVGLGAGFGLEQYVKPSSQILLPALLALPLLAGLPWRRLATVVVAAVLGFAVVVAPILAWNAQANDRLSISPYLYDGWILFAGLSIAHDGQLSDQDQADVWIATGLSSDGSAPSEVTNGTSPFDPRVLADQRRFNDTAGAMGIQRLETEGAQLIPLAVRKAAILWTRADQPVTWIFGGSSTARQRAARTLLQELSQLGWVVVLFGAVAGGTLVLRRTRIGGPGAPRPAEATAILLLVVGTAAIHLLAQVNPRFHEYLLPLLCGLAGIGMVELGRLVVGRRRVPVAVA